MWPWLKLEALEITTPQPDPVCVVVRNRFWLEDMLRSSKVESEMLMLLATAAHRRGRRLKRALQSLRMQTWPDVCRALAVILGEPVDEVAACFANPCRLALQLIEFDGEND